MTDRSKAQNTVKDFKLRAHHGMCLQFFVGKGYSSDFAANMGGLKEYLEEKDPTITLVAGDDNICAKCPNLTGSGCESYDKVKKYDLAVLSRVGFEPGRKIRYRDFIKLVADKIILSGKREDICGDCEWTDICR